ncbi:MAG: nucleotidyltransferase family protein [Pyrinomonadaceae bacterium]
MNKEVLSTERLRALLKAFKEQHAEEYHLHALGYFGSYARNEATPESDVDVVFQTDHPDLFITSMLKQDLETLLNHPVDVIRLRDGMNPDLKARIEQEATFV